MFKKPDSGHGQGKPRETRCTFLFWKHWTSFMFIIISREPKEQAFLHTFLQLWYFHCFARISAVVGLVNYFFPSGWLELRCVVTYLCRLTTGGLRIMRVGFFYYWWCCSLWGKKGRPIFVKMTGMASSATWQGMMRARICHETTPIMMDLVCHYTSYMR